MLNFEVTGQMINAHRLLPLNLLLTLQLGLCSILLQHPPQLLCFFLQEPEQDQADSAFQMLISCDKTCHCSRLYIHVRALTGKVVFMYCCVVPHSILCKIMQDQALQNFGKQVVCLIFEWQSKKI